MTKEVFRKIENRLKNLLFCNTQKLKLKNKYKLRP